MLTSLSYGYEEKFPNQSLTALIGLTLEENHLLTDLGEQAKTIAPFLGKALSARILEFAGQNNAYAISRADMQLYLQDWFLQLFQCREEKYIGFHEYYSSIPLNIMITGIDIILAYGEEVIIHSPHPKIATGAFHKALALKITSEQLQSQIGDPQHFYEMMLLD
jgi:hypothetical protein